MKVLSRFLPILISMVFLSCANDILRPTEEERVLQDAGDAPYVLADDCSFRSYEISRSDMAILVCEDNCGWPWRNIYADNEAGRHFLLNVSTDAFEECETIRSVSWFGDVVVFHVTGSRRFEGSTRLAVYRIDAGECEELLDEKNDAIASWAVEGDVLSWTLEDGAVKTLQLR